MLHLGRSRYEHEQLPFDTLVPSIYSLLISQQYANRPHLPIVLELERQYYDIARGLSRHDFFDMVAMACQLSCIGYRVFEYGNCYCGLVA